MKPASKIYPKCFAPLLCLEIGRLVVTLCCLLSAFSMKGGDCRLIAEVFAGGGEKLAPCTALTLKMDGPFGIQQDASGAAYAVEMTGNRVLKRDAHGWTTVLAGDGLKGNGGDGGLGIAAQLNGPHSLALSSRGDLYIADTFNNRVRALHTKTGVIRGVAGTGVSGFAGDGGLAVNAQCGGVYGISLEPRGRFLFLTDLDNRRIRKVDLTTGVITTVAGNGHRGIPADGSFAIDAPLVDPRSVTVDSKGNLFILERSGNALRQVDSQGHIRTVVGVSGKAGFSGDEGEGRTAQLNGAKDVGMDLDGTVLIADSDNHSVRRYDPHTGKISRVAGTGIKGAAGVGGDARECQLNQPHGIWVHPKSGDLYISDSTNQRILRLHR